MTTQTATLRILFVLIIGACLLSPSAPAEAAVNVWTRGGPTGGNITALAIDPTQPNTVYAGTYGGGVYKSVDGGASWNPANNFTPVNTNSYIINSILVDPFHPVNVYFFTPAGNYKSTNGGGQWATLTGITPLAFDPSTSGVVYASTSDGLYQSTDSGDHWTQKSAAQPGNTNVDKVLVAPTNPLILYSISTIGGVYKSTDGGSGWNSAKNGLSSPTYYRDLIIDPKSSATLYAVLYEPSARLYSLYKTVDGGANWNPASTGLDLTQIKINALAVDPATPTTLYLGTNLGIFKSVNGAGSWTLLSSEKVGVLTVNPTTPAILYAGTATHILKTTDSGQNWNPADAGMTAARVYSLAIDPVSPTNLYMASYTNGIYKSADLGATWNYSTNGITSNIQSLAINPQTPAILYAGAAKGIFKSTDSGNNWVPLTNELSNLSVGGLYIDPTNSSVMYASVYDTSSGNQVLYRSINYGDSWAYFSGGILDGRSTTSGLLIDPVQTSTLYIGYRDINGGTGGGIARYTSGNPNWVSINTGIEYSAYITSLTTDSKMPATLYAGGSYSTYVEGHAVTHPILYKSTDSGVDWMPFTTGLENSTTSFGVLSINPLNPKVMYLNAPPLGINKSIDGGTHWQSYNRGITYPYFGRVVIDPQNPENLYLGTSGGGLYSTQSMDYGQFVPVIQR